MGRVKVDRSNKQMISFEGTKPLKERLEFIAQERGITVSALIRLILEHCIEERIIFDGRETV